MAKLGLDVGVVGGSSRRALQWDDEHVERQSGLALFDAFASKEKTLDANSGGHAEVPRFEVDSAALFFVRHLGRVDTPPA